MFRIVALLVLCLIAVPNVAAGKDPSAPLPAQEAAKRMQLAPGFKATVFAAAADLVQAGTATVDESAIKSAIADLGKGYARNQAARRRLKSIGKPAIPHLLNAVTKGKGDVASYSAYLLGDIAKGDARVMSAYRGILKGSSDARVRREVLYALRMWKASALPAADELAAISRSQNRNERQIAIEALANLGKPAVRFLGPLIENENRGVRMASRWAFRVIGSDAFPAVSAAARHKDWRIRYDAVYVLLYCWEGPDGRAAKLMNDLWKDPEPMVRVALLIVSSRGKCGDQSCVKKWQKWLAPLLRHENAVVRYFSEHTAQSKRTVHRNFGRAPHKPTPHELKQFEQDRLTLDKLTRPAVKYVLTELKTARGMRQEVLIEWIGAMGSRGASAKTALEKLQRKKGSRLDSLIKGSLERMRSGDL